MWNISESLIARINDSNAALEGALKNSALQVPFPDDPSMFFKLVPTLRNTRYYW